MEADTGKTEKQPKRGFELIEKLILDGEAPVHIRVAAAKGALPLHPLALLRLKVFLTNDADPSVRSEALRGIEALPDEEALGLLKDGKCNSSVLAYYAERKKDDDRFLDAIIQNPSSSDETLARISESCSARVIGIMITNEQRLISAPGLLDLLEKNPAINEFLKAKIGELRAKFIKGSVPPQAVRETPGETKPAELQPELDVDALIGDSYIIGGDEFEKGPEDQRNIYKNILTMSVPEKVMHALRGSLLERQILIRDSHRIVSLTVLENPRITEQEIENISSSKNIDEEVLREVGRNRDWTKHYPVAINLVRNPKTPPSISTSLIHRLTNTDLKQMQSDKNIPELIRGMAKKVYETRTQKTGKPQKK